MPTGTAAFSPGQSGTPTGPAGKKRGAVLSQENGPSFLERGLWILAPLGYCTVTVVEALAGVPPSLVSDPPFTSLSRMVASQAPEQVSRGIV